MSELAEGGLAVVRADAGFAITLPDGRRLGLDGQTVRILRIERYALGGRHESVVFRPEPWAFDESAYPNAWAGSPKYFEPVSAPSQPPPNCKERNLGEGIIVNG